MSGRQRPDYFQSVVVGARIVEIDRISGAGLRRDRAIRRRTSGRGICCAELALREASDAQHHPPQSGYGKMPGAGGHSS